MAVCVRVGTVTVKVICNMNLSDLSHLWDRSHHVYCVAEFLHVTLLLPFYKHISFLNSILQSILCFKKSDDNLVF